jgi:hypothetical protein
MIPFSLYLRAGIVALVVILFVLTYAKGRTDGTYRCDQRINALLMESNEREKGYQIVAHTQSELLEKVRAKTEIRYRTILKKVEHEVEKPSYRVVCLTDDGVRLANDALRGAAIAPGEPADAVPGSRPSE